MHHWCTVTALVRMATDDMFKLQMRSGVNEEDTCKDEVEQDVVKINLCVPMRRARAMRI